MVGDIDDAVGAGVDRKAGDGVVELGGGVEELKLRAAVDGEGDVVAGGGAGAGGVVVGEGVLRAADLDDAAGDFEGCAGVDGDGSTGAGPGDGAGAGFLQVIAEPVGVAGARELGVHGRDVGGADGGFAVDLLHDREIDRFDGPG